MSFYHPDLIDELIPSYLTVRYGLKFRRPCHRIVTPAHPRPPVAGEWLTQDYLVVGLFNASIVVASWQFHT